MEFKFTDAVMVFDEDLTDIIIYSIDSFNI